MSQSNVPIMRKMRDRKTRVKYFILVLKMLVWIKLNQHLRWPRVVPRRSHSHEGVWVLPLNHTIHLNPQKTEII